MGVSQSASALVPSSSDDDDDDEDDEVVVEEEEDDEDVEDHRNIDDEQILRQSDPLKKVLQQEPEMLPCHASASPLSAFGTPRSLGPSIKVWDPYNVLAPPPPPSSSDHHLTLIYFISHADSHVNLRPDLISGRCPEAALTSNGKRQARALAVFFTSQAIRFNAVYTSPLDRARATALLVCQEMNIPEEQIRSADALIEMSQGHWEGCQRSEIMTPDTVSLMERHQPDFFAPSGESLRQVEFRMVQFLNSRISAFLPEKSGPDFSPPPPPPPPEEEDEEGVTRGFAHAFMDSIHHDRDRPPPPPPLQLDLLHRYRQGIPRKKSGKSRLQIVTTTGDHEADDEMSPREAPLNQSSSIQDSSSSGGGGGVRGMPSSLCYRIGVFTHSVPIKCALTGILGCSAAMSHKICIEDSSVTVLQHSWRTGWQIKRLNDNAHLRLL